jgi:hypothetical protein
MTIILSVTWRFPPGVDGVRVMDAESERLWDELSATADAFAEVARQLLAASRALHTPGALPAASLSEGLVDLGQRFAELRSWAIRLAGERSVAVPTADSVDTLKALANLVLRVVEAGPPSGPPREREVPEPLAPARCDPQPLPMPPIPARGAFVRTWRLDPAPQSGGVAWRAPIALDLPREASPPFI